MHNVNKIHFVTRFQRVLTKKLFLIHNAKRKPKQTINERDERLVNFIISSWTYILKHCKFITDKREITRINGNDKSDNLISKYFRNALFSSG